MNCDTTRTPPPTSTTDRSFGFRVCSIENAHPADLCHHISHVRFGVVARHADQHEQSAIDGARHAIIHANPRRGHALNNRSHEALTGVSDESG